VSSFDAFVRDRGDDLMRLARVLCASPDDAQDAVQDALTRALERWDTVSAADDVYAYVRRMVVNADVSRWRRTRMREIPRAEVVPSGVEMDHAESFALWRACQDLPDRQRAALVLRFYEGLSHAEIGEVLGVSEPTARSHVFRGLERLRTEFGEGARA
jgi:RNA polymerase sigma-70 factor (sigma-E family)